MKLRSDSGDGSSRARMFLLASQSQQRFQFAWELYLTAVIVKIVQPGGLGYALRALVGILF